jgi:glycosyltransferase involved in cell wall biosynthesis
MRALFLTLYPESMASPRYRVHQFLPYLRAQGIDCTVACPFTQDEFIRLRARAAEGRARSYHLHEARVRGVQILGARKYDVVFLQKAVMSAYVKGFAKQLRLRARKLIYDLDDAVHLAPPNALRGRWTRIEEPDQAAWLMANADLVLAGNSWLRDEALRAGGRAEVFPTVVDTERFTPADEAPEKFVVGWIGGPSTSEHVAPLAEVLNGLEDAEVRLIGANPVRAAIEKAWHRPWTHETEVREVQQFSIGIMPLPQTDWARGKCALKALQYMACGVPCIATPFGAVTDIIEDGVSGLFAQTPEEWRAAIERVRSAKLRAKLGKAARATVEERFSLHVAAPKLRAFLETAAA